MSKYGIKETLGKLKKAVNDEHALVTLEVAFTNILIDSLLEDYMESFVTNIDAKHDGEIKRLNIESKRYIFYVDKEFIEEDIFRYVLVAEVKVDPNIEYDLVYVEIYEDEMYNDSYLSDRKIDLYRDILKDYKLSNSSQ